MGLLRFINDLFNIGETYNRVLNDAMDNVERKQEQVRDNVLTVAYHVGFAHYWYEKTHYPFLYVAYSDDCFRRGQEEAAAAWKSNRYYQKAALTAFVDKYMEGWQAAQELDLGV